MGKGSKAGKPTGAMLTMVEWMSFLERFGLFGDSFTKREGRLAFTWCKMLISDELRNRLGFVGMSFVDFLEALCRVAQLKALPSKELLKKYDLDKEGGTWEFLQNLEPDTAKLLYEEEEAKGHLHTLQDRLPKLFELIWGLLGFTEGVPTAREVQISLDVK